MTSPFTDPTVLLVAIKPNDGEVRYLYRPLLKTYQTLLNVSLDVGTSKEIPVDLSGQILDYLLMFATDRWSVPFDSMLPSDMVSFIKGFDYLGGSLKTGESNGFGVVADLIFQSFQESGGPYWENFYNTGIDIYSPKGAIQVLNMFMEGKIIRSRERMIYRGPPVLPAELLAEEEKLH